MRYIIIAITLITTLNLKAQKTDNHFVLEEGKVSRIKIYETRKTKKDTGKNGF